VALWITRAFHILLTWGVKVIAGFIPIHFLLNKIIGQHYLHTMTLSKQHAINSLLDEHHSKKATLHHMTTFHLTPNQLLKIKNPVVNSNNHLNEVFPSFDSLNKELSSSFHLVDTFSDHFFFIQLTEKTLMQNCTL